MQVLRTARSLLPLKTSYAQPLVGRRTVLVCTICTCATPCACVVVHRSDTARAMTSSRHIFHLRAICCLCGCINPPAAFVHSPLLPHPRAVLPAGGSSITKATEAMKRHGPALLNPPFLTAQLHVPLLLLLLLHLIPSRRWQQHHKGSRSYEAPWPSAADSYPRTTEAAAVPQASHAQTCHAPRAGLAGRGRPISHSCAGRGASLTKAA